MYSDSWSDGEYSHDYRKRLERNFKKLSSNGFLEKVKFQEVMVEEVVDSAIKKAQYDTLQRWEDLTQLGVLEEVWDACFGFEKKYISFTELLAVFETKDEHKSEAEKLLDLCSEDEALRNHAYDLEQCLQSNKDMLAAADIMVEEQGEKLKALEEDLLKTKRECEQLQKQSKDLDSWKTKVKNMESEHRLLKRDFDLVFATNKSVQKKMERAELENRALRKTIVTLANQIEKIEREKADGAVINFTTSPATAVMPLHLANDTLNTSVTAATFIPQNDQTLQNFSVAYPAPVQQPPHMVWDPAVRALVPIMGDGRRAQLPITGDARRAPRQNHNPKHKGKKKYCDQSGVSNGRLISPFPRRYTSSHLPRYRRKFEMTEQNRYDKQSQV